MGFVTRVWQREAGYDSAELGGRRADGIDMPSVPLPYGNRAAGEAK